MSGFRWRNMDGTIHGGTGDAPPVDLRPGLVYDFPLRADFMAQLVLPRDLTSAEAKRLMAFLESLVTPGGTDGVA